MNIKPPVTYSEHCVIGWDLVKMILREPQAYMKGALDAGLKEPNQPNPRQIESTI
jgi:hypothetical protein